MIDIICKILALNLCFSFGYSQNVVKTKLGLDFSFLKYNYYPADYNEIFLEDIGPVYINQSSNFSYKINADCFIQKERNISIFRYGIGLHSDARNISKNSISGPLNLNTVSVKAVTHSISIHGIYGVYIYGKRFCHIYASGGIYYSLIPLYKEYNPINIGLDAIENDQISESVLGKDYDLIVEKTYAFPKTTFSVGLNATIENFILSCNYNYSGSEFDLFKRSKPYLIKKSSTVNLKLAYVINVLYKQK